MARNSFYEGDIGTEVAIDTSASEAAAEAPAKPVPIIITSKFRLFEGLTKGTFAL